MCGAAYQTINGAGHINRVVESTPPCPTTTTTTTTTTLPPPPGCLSGRHSHTSNGVDCHRHSTVPPTTCGATYRTINGAGHINRVVESTPPCPTTTPTTTTTTLPPQDLRLRWVDVGSVTEGDTVEMTATLDAPAPRDLRLTPSRTLYSPNAGYTRGYTSSDDYTMCSSFWLRKGQTVSEPCKLTAAVNDDDNDGNVHEPGHSERVVVRFGPVTGIRSVSCRCARIVEVELPPTVTVSAKHVSVTEGTGAVATFTITAVPAPTEPVTVRYTVTESGGYVTDSRLLGARTVRLSAGVSSTTTTVQISDDDVDEPDGSVTVTLNTGNGYGLGTANSVAVTVNDDDTRAVTVSKAASTVTEGGTDTYTVVLNSEPTATVTVTVTSSDPAVATAAPTSLTFTAGNWDTAVTGVAPANERTS